MAMTCVLTARQARGYVLMLSKWTNYNILIFFYQLRWYLIDDKIEVAYQYEVEDLG